MHSLRRFILTGLAVLSVCSCALAQTPVTAAPQPSDEQAIAALRAFFAETDAAKRTGLAAKVGPLMPADVARWPALLRRGYPFPNQQAGQIAFEAPAEGAIPAVKYVVNVPADYRADPAKPWPLIVGLCGTGGTAAGHMASLARWMGDDFHRYLVACAEPWDKEVFRFSEPNSMHPLLVLNDVRRRFNVDSDRTVLTGYSRGGYITWAAALFAPGQWGGAAPMAAFPLTNLAKRGADFYLTNVLELDLQYHWGDKDIMPGQTEGIGTYGQTVAAQMTKLRATRFEPLEYVGQGHSLNVDTAKFRAFLAKARRTPWPVSYTFVCHYMWQGNAYHARTVKPSVLELDFKNLPTLRVSDPSSPAQVEGAILKLFRDRAYEIQATFGAEANSLALRTRNLRQIEIFLSPQQLDFSKSVKVVVDGKPVQDKKLAVDWPLLLDTVRTSGDFDRLIGAKILHNASR